MHQTQRADRRLSNTTRWGKKEIAELVKIKRHHSQPLSYLFWCLNWDAVFPFENLVLVAKRLEEQF